MALPYRGFTNPKPGWGERLFWWIRRKLAGDDYNPMDEWKARKGIYTKSYIEMRWGIRKKQ